jgi:hypothetical protein
MNAVPAAPSAPTSEANSDLDECEVLLKRAIEMVRGPARASRAAGTSTSVDSDGELDECGVLLGRAIEMVHGTAESAGSPAALVAPALIHLPPPNSVQALVEAESDLDECEALLRVRGPKGGYGAPPKTPTESNNSVPVHSAPGKSLFASEAGMSQLDECETMTVTEFASVEWKGHDGLHVGQGAQALNLYKIIDQTERDQSADGTRIDDAIVRAEKEIARLEQRQLAPEQLREETVAIRDRAVLITREMRKQMQRRALAAKRVQDRMSDIFRQRSRFAISDSEDKSLRKHFMGLLERTETSALIDHLCDAVEVGNTACAELIRFEFQCRDDRHEFRPRFEAIVAKLCPEDPVEMRKRLVNIYKAIEKVDTRIANLLQ